MLGSQKSAGFSIMPSAIRHLSSMPAPATDEGAAAPAIDNSDRSEVSIAYTQMMFKGRRGNALGLGELRKLLQLCAEPAHANYALQAVKLFQTKGQDFSEEVNSHFISAVAERGGSPLEAGRMLAVPKNRIGAWSTTKSLTKLVEAMVAAEGALSASAHAEDDEEDDEEEEEEEEALTGRKARTAEKRAAKAAANPPLTAAQIAVQVLEVAFAKGVHVTPELCAQIEPMLGEEEVQEEAGEEEEAAEPSGEYVPPVPLTVHQRHAALSAAVSAKA